MALLCSIFVLAVAPQTALSSDPAVSPGPGVITLEAGEALVAMPDFDLSVSSEAVSAWLGDGTSWTWTLTGIRMGSELELGSETTERSDIAAGAAINRGPVSEHYLVRGGVIEQRFVIARPFGDAGADLEIYGTVDTAADIFTKLPDGWVWEQDDGQAIAMGPAIAFDASGAPLEVFFDVDHDGTYLRIDADELAGAEYPVTIDPAIGPDDLVVSSAGTSGSSAARADDAAIAYSPTAGGFLVVWSADDTNFGSTVDNELEVYGRWVTADSFGMAPAAGDAFRISTQGVDGDAAVDARQPAIVYAPVADLFLVVWSGDLTAGNDEIYGQVLDGTTGALVGSNFLISGQSAGDGSVDCLSPAVAWSSDQNEFGVAWESDVVGNGHQEIWARRVDSTGATVEDVERISNIGTEMTTAQDSTDPDLVYDPATGSYLFVWEGDPIAGDNQIFAVQSDGLLEVSDTVTTVSQLGPGDGSLDAARPALALNSVSGGYLVAWFGDGVDGVYSVWAQLLDETATEVGTDFEVVSPWSAGETAGDVALAYDSIDDEFLIAWEVDNGATTQIAARTVDAAGTLLGSPELLSNLMVEGGVGDAFDPAVAFAPVVDEFLVAFEGDDTRDGRVDDEDEIFAQFYGDEDAADSDSDGTRDELDGCPDDPGKVEPGVCGCGVAEDESDTDEDSVVDCVDACPDVAGLVEFDGCPATEDVGPDAGDVGEDAGDVGEDAGDVGEDAGDVGEDAGDVGEDAGDVGEDAGDVGEDAGDVGEDAGDVGEDAGDVGEDAAAPNTDANVDSGGGPDTGSDVPLPTDSGCECSSSPRPAPLLALWCLGVVAMSRRRSNWGRV